MTTTPCVRSDSARTPTPTTSAPLVEGWLDRSTRTPAATTPRWHRSTTPRRGRCTSSRGRRTEPAGDDDGEATATAGGDDSWDDDDDVVVGSVRQHDIPSFTVEALPVETFEAMLVAAGWLGEVIDDDPPYRLDVHMTEPFECWCRFDVVPDAGASTVSLTVAAWAESPVAPVELVRDVWVDVLNRLDWSALSDAAPPP